MIYIQFKTKNNNNYRLWQVNLHVFSRVLAELDPDNIQGLIS